MPRIPALGWLILLFLGFSAPAAVGGERPAPESLPQGVFRLTWADAALAAGGAGLQAWAQLRYQDMKPVDPGTLDAGDLNLLDRRAAGRYHAPSALLSDIVAVTLLAAPVAVSAWEARREGQGWHPVLVESVVLAEALAISSSLNLLVRSLRIHPRPLTYPGSDAPVSEKRKGEASGSFYSGHANAAFVAAVHLAYAHSLRHPDCGADAWFWAGGLGAAATVAGLRVAAGKHFPSDVLAGAAAGAFFGWLFPRLHLDPGRRRIQVGLVPAADGARLHLARSF